MLSFINASAHRDNSCAQLKWSYHFSSFIYKCTVYISCVIDYIPGRSMINNIVYFFIELFHTQMTRPKGYSRFARFL